jgi:C_GCAxxG_C_C family probable redox protein
MSKLLNHSVKQAIARFEEGYACSQAILSAFAGEFGLSDDLALKLSAPFGGGMGRQGEVCGAVTGALMLIGLKTGNITATDRTAKEQTYTLVEEFVTQFRTRHKTIVCRELLGCELNTAEGMQQAKEQQLFTKICSKVVQDAAEIVSELLSEPVRL